jgi:hypothetical protein
VGFCPLAVAAGITHPFLWAAKNLAVSRLLSERQYNEINQQKD